MAMLGTDVREVMESILPDEALAALVGKAGFQQRERKCEALLLLRMMILCAASGRGGRQADIAEDYSPQAPRLSPAAACTAGLDLRLSRSWRGFATARLRMLGR
jgi:hypothetical protein